MSKESKQIEAKTIFAKKNITASEQASTLLGLSSDLHRCPNNGRILFSNEGDDKVLCICGHSNPKVRGMGSTREEPQGLHYKELLEPATLTDFVAQEQNLPQVFRYGVQLPAGADGG